MKVLDLGRVAYAAALEIQEALVDRRIRGDAEDTLLLLEHHPVIVTGRASTGRASTGRASAGRGNILVRPERLKEMGIELAASNRGGDVTYHGPGQLVGYPIVDLAKRGRDLHGYLRRLEEFLIAALAGYGIRAAAKRGLTGVWVGSRKIASVGIAVRKWVAYHGFALNVGRSLEGFSLIRPCGLPASTMTSMEEVLGRPVCGRDLKGVLAGRLERALDDGAADC